MRVQFITFDCYGTLVDWEGGISAAFAGALKGHGICPDFAVLLEAYARIEPQVEEEAFRSYREVLHETAWRLCQEFDWPLTREACSFLPDSLKDWVPFPDTNAALKRIAKRGVKLGILSNVDDDLLRGTLERLDVDFELIITAEQVRSYKPHPTHFEEARRRIGDDVAWWHAAQSLFHDVKPARELDIPVVWVNRKRECGRDAQPDVEVSDLASLAVAVIDDDPPLVRASATVETVQTNPG